MKKISTLFAFGCAALLGAAATPDFTANFDQDGNFTDAAGQTVAGKYSQPGTPELVGGKSGKALRVGANADKSQGYNVIYQNPALLNPEAGTIALWIKPVDWDVTDKLYHVMFRAVGPKCDMLLYKVPNDWGAILRFTIGVTGADGKKLWSQVSYSVANWKRGEWHFVAATWDKEKVTLAIDGGPTRTGKTELLPGSFTRCGAGGLNPHKWNGPTPGSTHLDELKLFKRALTPSEIKALYQAK